MQVLDFFHSDFQAIFDLRTYLENKNVLHHTYYFQHCRVLLFWGIHGKVNTVGCKNSGNLWNLDAIL